MLDEADAVETSEEVGELEELGEVSERRDGGRAVPYFARGVSSGLAWPVMLRPPTAPPTEAPTMIKIMTRATTKNVGTFMPKMMRGARHPRP